MKKKTILIVIFIISIIKINAQEDIFILKNDSIVININDSLVYKKGNLINGEIKIKNSFNCYLIYLINNGDIVKKSYYDFDNKPLYIENYKNGELNGEYLEWYNNKNIRLKGNYNEGLADSTWSFYYSNGKVQCTGNFLPEKSKLIPNFELIQNEKSIDGVVTSSFNEFTNFSPPHGEWIFYNYDGVKNKILKFNKGVLISIEVGDVVPR